VENRIKMTFVLNVPMKVLVIHRDNNGSGHGVFRFALSTEPVSSFVLDGLGRSLCWGLKGRTFCAVPEEWGVELRTASIELVPYANDVVIGLGRLPKTKRDLWCAVSNGRFAAQVNVDLMQRVLTDVQADVIAVTVDPQLRAHRDRVRLTTHGNVAGLCRLYADSAEPAPFPTHWPHHLFIRTDVLERVLPDRHLPESFSVLSDMCRSNGLTMRAVCVGGTVRDLDTEEGLLGLLATGISFSPITSPDRNHKSRGWILQKDAITVSDSAKLSGKILLGQNVSIGENAIVVGPAIIGNDVRIEQGAVIRASIVGPRVLIPRNHVLQNRVLIGPVRGRRIMHPESGSRSGRSHSRPIADGEIVREDSGPNSFRTWPKLSYPGCFKRIADIITAVTVLIFFAPFLPVIALAVKLNSRGPVFFKDRRQGLHGKTFECLKFRTMLVGADQMQEKLRVVNQADGPQFKVADDPRVSAVGRFLRNTYIDEIPQFVNVLSGRMSVVGPRPSPEVENTLCAPWRDARLSVRPGITGLWQVCRTRQPMKDFQEWIHYDIKYVRDLSLKLDLWICWRTVRQMLESFARQF